MRNYSERTYDIFDDISKDNLYKYVNEDYVAKFIFKHFDEWKKDAAKLTLDWFSLEDIFNLDMDDAQRLLGNLNNQQLINLLLHECIEDLKSIVEENLDNYIGELDLVDYYFDDIIEDAKYEILDEIQDSLDYSNDPYSYSGVSRRDFF